MSKQSANVRTFFPAPHGSPAREIRISMHGREEFLMHFLRVNDEGDGKGQKGRRLADIEIELMMIY